MPFDPPDPVQEEPGVSPPPSTDRDLTFADQPRLELDQLLAQLVDRAREVMGTQDRLRGLLRANQSIIGDRGMRDVLAQIVSAARELVGARYAALGVLDRHGGLAEFVHEGMPPEAVGPSAISPGARACSAP